MKRRGGIVSGFVLTLLAVSLVASGVQTDGQADEPPLLEPQTGGGILKKLPLKKVVGVLSQQSAKTADLLALSITCPSGSTSRPLDFTACGTGPDPSEIVGTLLNDDISFLVPGTTTMQPPNWQIQFSCSGPGTGVFLRAEILDPFEQLDSAQFDVVAEGGTSCDKDCGIENASKRIVAKANLQGKPALAPRERGNMHMDAMAAVHTLNDEVVASGKLPPSGKKVYGMIVRRTAGGVRSPTIKKAREIDSDGDGKMDRYFISFGKQTPGTYTVGIRSTKRGPGPEWVNQDTLVRN